MDITARDFRMAEATSISRFQTVSQWAAHTAVHRAFQWFHLQEPKLREWHRIVTAIPAPTFAEGERAAWLAEQFRSLGLSDVHLDDCGNALGFLPALEPAQDTSWKSCILVSAHLDTVFPAEAIGAPVQEDSLLRSPGASDNCAGITALLALAAAMRFAGLRPATGILFAGNVGEEGEGNLRGMRHLFTESPWATRIRSAVVLDGAGTDSIVTQALGSKRFNIAISGPGGHSWMDAGTPNPVLALAHALTAIAAIELPQSPRTTWNVGHIEGGTGINVIPQLVKARIDTRSTDANMLAHLEQHIRRAVADSVANANAAASQRHPNSLQFQIDLIGERPAAVIDPDAEILSALRAIDRHLGIHSQLRIASTDANIPLSLDIPAVSIGSGGSGGGVHTLQEWFDATGRDLALRRILLLLLVLAQAEAELGNLRLP
jgi:acetylornithine deacetylase/succinyl-diaminopimelate desuccinylase-like protein